MLKKRIIVLWVLAVSMLVANRLWAAEAACPESYYGVCGHIANGDPLMPQKLVKMREAGIRWTRADFSWEWVETQPGEWHFDSIDALVDEAEKNGISILPILNYSNRWASPAVEHLDEWCNYVRTIVTRYKDRLRYWEVWNEENLKGFWDKDPNGTEYTKLLQASYETIKEIDSDLMVLYGGLSGVPKDYIEETLQAGAGNYFDVMNFHPYRGGLFSMRVDNDLVADITAVRDLLEKYHLADKPIWITEMGWATLPGADSGFAVFIEAVWNLMKSDDSLKIAYIDDPKYPETQTSYLIPAMLALPDAITWVPIPVEELASIAPEQYGMLILPPGENFPAPYFDDLYRYVQNGGTLMVSGGAPFYYGVNPNEDGLWVRDPQESPETFRNKMRIGWRASWFDDEVPDSSDTILPTDAVRQTNSNPEKTDQAFVKAVCSHFLSDARLTEGDEMIPLAVDAKNDAQFPCAVLYRFNSDLKGNLVVSTIWQWSIMNTATETDQAAYLAQSMLLARTSGAAKYFWYEFQSSEADYTDNESFFGITHADLSPKPAYFAYKTLTTAAPDGSCDFRRRTTNSGIEIISWKRPDGKKAWAVWAPGHFREDSLQVDGTVEQAFDLIGEPIDAVLDHGVLTQTWKPVIQYFIGPENISPLP